MSVIQPEARIYGKTVITNGILEFESVAADTVTTKVRTLFTCVYHKKRVMGR